MKMAQINVEQDLKEITTHLDELVLNKHPSLKVEEKEQEGDKENVYKQAAKKIKEANVLIFLSGQDIAHEYKNEGYDYADLCTPSWLEEDPDLFYGFWGSCFNEYRAKVPHLGYNIIRAS
eukprot:Awhi_evm1s13806